MEPSWEGKSIKNRSKRASKSDEKMYAIKTYFERLLEALLSKMGPHDYPNLTKRERKA